MQIEDLPIQEIAQLFDRDQEDVARACQEWLANRKSRNKPIVPDIRLLASLSNLSTASISNFLRNKQGSVSEAKAHRLTQLVTMVGYVPSSAAQSLRGQHNNAIGIAMPLSSISPDFYLEILAGIKQEADILGYRQLIFDVTTVAARDEFFDKMPFLGIVDGLIAIGLYIDEARLRILQRQHLPVAAVHNRLEFPPVVTNVLTQSEVVFQDLINKHLIKQHGYRRLALVTLDTSNPLKMGGDDRKDLTRSALINGYKEALRLNDIPIDETLILKVNEHSFEAGYAAFDRIQQLNETNPPDRRLDAVVCTSDTLAAAVLTAARRQGMEIPVTGFDNLPLAKLLDITTIEQRARHVGRLAFRHLYNALIYSRRTGVFPPLVEERIDMQPVIRCSCGCPHERSHQELPFD